MSKNKFKILIISFQIPFPLRNGGSIAQYFFLKEMTEKYNVTFCTLAQNSSTTNCVN